MATTTVDKNQLEAKVNDMYRHVTTQTDGGFHFEFISDRARGASEKYGVKSVSVLAPKA